jgi:hypothetical protein
MNQLVNSELAPDVARARQALRATGRSFVTRRAAAVLLPTVAGAGLLLVLGRQWPAAQPLLFGAALLGLAAVAWQLWPLRQVGPATVAPRLDRQLAALEDSTGLLLRPAGELNPLEQFQQRRVARQINELSTRRRLRLPVDFRGALGLTGLLLLVGAVMWWLPKNPADAAPSPVTMHFSPAPKSVAPGQEAPRIAETVLLVTPPAYARQAPFVPAQASFQCPQGARVRWQVRVSGPRQAAPVLELGQRKVRLPAVPGRDGWFATEQVLAASTLYRLRYAGTVSDDYAIEVRPDQAPVLRIVTPKPYTLVASLGQRPAMPIRATVRDDYGLTRAELVITVAQGQGEAVKFREVRRDLSAGLTGQAQASLNHVLDLPKLGLTYGDELYFYLTARDNNGHTARTDSYLVQWQDTAVADSPTDMGMGVKVAPAYFRSERQIIIDTEKLIAEKPRLDAATVASRANALGFDQQTLRLRYGKFMGEEAEAGIGAEAVPHAPIAEDEDAPALPTAEEPGHDDHDHAAPTSPAKSSPTAETDALMDPYMHKHDDAETADFLEPAVKAKLRAVLDQMWAAELRLRTGQLREARPYEYRALRLLKEVQQQTRVFVKKAGFIPPPMPEATLRLTGELAGAAVPHRQQTLPAPVTQPAVRAALRWLAATESGTPARPADAALLDQAGSALAGAALTQPGAYLPALRALRELVGDVRAGRPACAGCRPVVARALTDLLATPPPAPAPPPAPDRLARRYFQELSR